MRKRVIANFYRRIETCYLVDGSHFEKHISQFLLRIAENNPKELNAFWIKQGAALLLDLLQSSQEDVQERAANSIATFVVIDDENATVDSQRAEVVMQNGGIQLLLDLAGSCQEGLQSEAAKVRVISFRCHSSSFLQFERHLVSH